MIEPTLTELLPRAAELRARVDQELWSSVIERPLGQLIEARFADDTVRGLVLTDAVIGTFTSAHDPSLQQNRCFLYHMIGNGDGEWRVPVGGMGAVTAELVRVAQEAKVSIRTGCPVDAIKPLPDGGATIFLADREAITADVILANCAPATLQRLLGNPYQPPVGSNQDQHRSAPAACFRSGLEPAIGFAGTLHLGQGYGRLQQAYEDASAGQILDPMPCEIYCHTLTDGSILDPELRPRATTRLPCSVCTHLRACSCRIQRGRGRGRKMPRCALSARCSLNRWSPASPSTDVGNHASR